MRRRKIKVSKLNHSIKLICIIVSVSFIIIQIVSSLHLTTHSPKPKIPKINPSRTAKIGELGLAVIGMLPEDLAFTLFLPSDEAFRRDLRLNRSDEESYATLTRLLGFAAVPRWITAADLERGEEKVYDSISGLSLYVTKGVSERVVVNGVVAEEVGVKMGMVLVYVMNGVVMDAEFELSVRPDNDDGDERRRRRRRRR